MNKPNSRKPVRYKFYLVMDGYLVSIDVVVARRQDSIFVRKKAYYG